jgi:hypothetical protein
MRIPIEPLNAVEIAAPAESEDVRQTEAVVAVRRVRADLPKPNTGLAIPRRQGTSEAAPVPDIYQGEDRRQGERRVVSQPALIDTRARRDRRRASGASVRVDLEI